MAIKVDFDTLTNPACVRIQRFEVSGDDPFYYPRQKNNLYFNFSYAANTLEIKWVDAGLILVPATYYSDYGLNGTPCASYSDLINFVAENFYTAGSGGGGGGDATAANQVIGNSTLSDMLASLQNIEGSTYSIEAYDSNIQNNTSDTAANTNTMIGQLGDLAGIAVDIAAMQTDLAEINGSLILISGFQWSNSLSNVTTGGGRMVVGIYNITDRAWANPYDLTTPTLDGAEIACCLQNVNAQKAINYASITGYSSKIFVAANAPVGKTMLILLARAH